MQGTVLLAQMSATMGRAILLALLCLSAAVTSRAAGSFELYILVRSFSPTLCKQEACTTRPV